MNRSSVIHRTGKPFFRLEITCVQCLNKIERAMLWNESLEDIFPHDWIVPGGNPICNQCFEIAEAKEEAKP